MNIKKLPVVVLVLSVFGLLGCGGNSNGPASPRPGNNNSGPSANIDIVCETTAIDPITGCWFSPQCIQTAVASQWQRNVLSFTSDKKIHDNTVVYSNSNCTGQPLYAVIDIGGTPTYAIEGSAMTTSGLTGNILSLDASRGTGTVFYVDTVSNPSRLCFMRGHYTANNGLDANAQVGTAGPYELDLVICPQKGVL